MKWRKVSAEGAAIEAWEGEMTPEEKKALSAPGDAWAYIFNEETTWQVIKRKSRKLLKVMGIDWRKIPGIRGQWKHYQEDRKI